jgi:hypothetical protein
MPRFYVQSLKTFQQDWSYRNTEAGLERSTARLKAWFQSLDEEMKTTASAFSDEDLNKTIERGFAVPVELQLEIYLQAMNKPLPQQMQEWIGQSPY